MLVIAFLGTGCLTLAGIGTYAWSRLRSRKVQQRLQRVASLLSGEDVEQAPEAEETIFRAVESESWFARLRTSIETRYPLLDARRALPRALAICLLVSAIAWLSMWFLRVPQGWWTIPIIGIVGAIATWYALSWFHERQVTEFVRQLPEVVDQIVRLSARRRSARGSDLGRRGRLAGARETDSERCSRQADCRA